MARNPARDAQKALKAEKKADRKVAALRATAFGWNLTKTERGKAALEQANRDIKRAGDDAKRARERRGGGENTSGHRRRVTDAVPLAKTEGSLSERIKARNPFAALKETQDALKAHGFKAQKAKTAAGKADQEELAKALDKVPKVRHPDADKAEKDHKQMGVDADAARDKSMARNPKASPIHAIKAIQAQSEPAPNSRAVNAPLGSGQSRVRRPVDTITRADGTVVRITEVERVNPPGNAPVTGRIDPKTGKRIPVGQKPKDKPKPPQPPQHDPYAKSREDNPPPGKEDDSAKNSGFKTESRSSGHGRSNRSPGSSESLVTGLPEDSPIQALKDAKRLPRWAKPMSEGGMSDNRRVTPGTGTRRAADTPPTPAEHRGLGGVKMPKTGNEIIKHVVAQGWTAEKTKNGIRLKSPDGKTTVGLRGRHGSMSGEPLHRGATLEDLRHGGVTFPDGKPSHAKTKKTAKPPSIFAAPKSPLAPPKTPASPRVREPKVNIQNPNKQPQADRRNPDKPSYRNPGNPDQQRKPDEKGKVNTKPIVTPKPPPYTGPPPIPPYVKPPEDKSGIVAVRKPKEGPKPPPIPPYKRPPHTDVPPIIPPIPDTGITTAIIPGSRVAFTVKPRRLKTRVLTRR